MGVTTVAMGSRFDVSITSNSISLILTLALIFFLVLFFSPKASFAAEWSIIPRISVSETYDDNVRLAGEGQEEDDYISQINPGFSVVGKGRYSQLLLDYTMQNIFYKNNDKYDDTYHNLRASNNTEIYRDHLFLDASANYSQRIINLQQTSSTDNAAISDNRTDVAAYTVKPYYINNFGHTSMLRLEHTYNELDSKNDELRETDNTVNTSYVELKSGPAFKRFTWQISHQKQSVEYRERSSVKSLNSQALLNYLFTKKVYFVGVAGYEEYNYAVMAGQKNPEGSYWEAGLGWTPSHRTRLEIRQGEHYYGETSKFLFDHRTRQSTWSINYSEEINTTSRTEPQIDTEFFNPETEAFEETPIDISYSDVAVVSLDKVLSASVSKMTAKTVLTLNVSDSRRIYQERPGEERNASATVSWKWQVARRTSVNLQEKLEERKFTVPDREIKTGQHLLSVDYNISTNASAYFSYDNTTQESKSEGIFYRRNTYTLGLTASF